MRRQAPPVPQRRRQEVRGRDRRCRRRRAGRLAGRDGTDDFTKWKPPIPFGSSCTFLDYDGDGRLDLFVCHYVTWSPAIDLSIDSTLDRRQPRRIGSRTSFEGSQCTLYRNVDGKTFEDVSEKAGIVVYVEGRDRRERPAAARRQSRSASSSAIRTTTAGRTSSSPTTRCGTSSSTTSDGRTASACSRRIGMPIGAAYADEGTTARRHGHRLGRVRRRSLAAVIANFANEPITFLEKNAEHAAVLRLDAERRSCRARAAQPLKFGTFFFDYDNDGRLDLLLCNGHIEPEIAKIQTSQTYAQPAQLFWNTGDRRAATSNRSTAKQAGDDLFKPMVGRGSAFADSRRRRRPRRGARRQRRRSPHPAQRRAEEQTTGSRLDLRGDGVKSNRSAIGAVVTVEAGGQTITRQVTGGRGYLSQSELVLTVGLGKADEDRQGDRPLARQGRDARETWTNLDADKTARAEAGRSEDVDSTDSPDSTDATDISTRTSAAAPSSPAGRPRGSSASSSSAARSSRVCFVWGRTRGRRSRRNPTSSRRCRRQHCAASRKWSVMNIVDARSRV